MMPTMLGGISMLAGVLQVQPHEIMDGSVLGVRNNNFEFLNVSVMSTIWLLVAPWLR